MLTTTAFAACLTVCGLDSPFTLSLTVRVPPIESLHLPGILDFGFCILDLHSNLKFQTCNLKLTGLARDYHAKGFPEFERRSQASFLTYSP